MKKNIKYIFSLICLLGITSCDSFFDLDNHQRVKTENAFESVQDVKNGTTGAYYQLGSRDFLGKVAVAIGDMASDLATGNSSSGHLYHLSTYNITTETGDIKDVWTGGNAVIDKCVRTIRGSKKLISEKEKYNLSDKDIQELTFEMSQCYSLKALSTFVLTNLFGLPYQPGVDNTQLGIPLLSDEPLDPSVEIKRNTVEECYKNILAEIQLAKDYYVMDFNSDPQFYMNKAAIFALEARVKLFMGKYDEAITAAKEAVNLRGANEITAEKYLNMWKENTISDEDIFAIVKTSDDNLSAYSLNTLYGSYGGAINDTTIKSFAATDYRAEVANTYAYKYQGIKASAAASNIRVFRVSEMKLIVAESEARLNNLAKAKEALLYTAKRNSAIKTVNNLPNTIDELLIFISKERIRELYLEGFRWFDTRRTGEMIIPNGFGKPFDVSKFVYPIPSAEINAGFMIQQNEGWHENLPKKEKVKNLKS